jgi:hypothetical protein
MKLSLPSGLLNEKPCNKQKLKEFMTIKPALKKLFKGIPQTEDLDSARKMQQRISPTDQVDQ